MDSGCGIWIYVVYYKQHFHEQKYATIVLMDLLYFQLKSALFKE